MPQGVLRMMALQGIIERVILCKGNEQHIPPQTDPTVDRFRNMLLVSVLLHLGRRNRAKCSNHNCVLG